MFICNKSIDSSIWIYMGLDGRVLGIVAATFHTTRSQYIQILDYCYAMNCLVGLGGQMVT